MSVEKELLKVKRRLRYFDRSSVLIEIDRFLSEHPEHSVERFRRLPFLSFLVVEWLFEVTPHKSTRVASKKDVYWFVNRLFELNGKTTAEEICFWEIGNTEIDKSFPTTMVARRGR